MGGDKGNRWTKGFVNSWLRPEILVTGYVPYSSCVYFAVATVRWPVRRRCCPPLPHASAVSRRCRKLGRATRSSYADDIDRNSRNPTRRPFSASSHSMLVTYSRGVHTGRTERRRRRRRSPDPAPLLPCPVLPPNFLQRAVNCKDEHLKCTSVSKAPLSSF